MWPNAIHHKCDKEKEVMSDGSGEPGASWMDWCPSHLEEGEGNMLGISGRSRG